ncbi:MAG: oxygenase MpaB family protein [Bacteroidota bacterium]
MKTFTDVLLDRMRQVGDEPADQLIQSTIAPLPKAILQQWMQFLTHTRVEWPTFLPQQVRQFFKAVQLPEWVDTAKLEKGSRFFQQQQARILFLLGTYSLPYCYAAAKGVKVLYLSERIQKDTYNRLQETATFIETMMQPQVLEKPEGLINCTKVRLLHATIRYFTLKHAQWDNTWGTPINQEDMAGTNLAFSYIILRGLRKMKVNYTPQEAESYLYTWRVIGHLLGVDERLAAENRQQAYWLDKMIAKRQFAPSKEGALLTKALIDLFEEQHYLLGKIGTNQMRFLLGDTLANALRVPHYNYTRMMIPLVQIQNFTQSLFKKAS